MRISIQISILMMFLLIACSESETAIPKPRGYVRFELPEKKYTAYSGDCPFTFEFPEYANVESQGTRPEELCNKNLQFSSFNGTLHITYKSLNNDVGNYIEDCHDMVYQHTVKAYDISARQYLNDESKVYGLLYDIKGNAASPLQFYLTDSTKNFIRGALYFNTKPNYDSILPVLEFIKEDVQHFVETFNWKNQN